MTSLGRWRFPCTHSPSCVGPLVHRPLLSILNLVRDVYPALLRKADRGKFHDLTSVPVQYGEQRVADGVQGAELLEAYERGEIIVDDDEVIFKEDLEKIAEDEDDEDEEEEEEDDDDEECPDLVDPDNVADAAEEGDEEEEDDDDEEEEDDDEEGWESVEEGDEDAEEDDEGEEDEWVAVDDGDAKAAAATAPPRNIRTRVDARRILTSEDFALLERLRAAQAERLRDPKRRSGGGAASSSAMAKIESRKREREEDEEEAGGMSFAVEPGSLGAATKTGKMSKIERIAHVLEGRKESKFEHNGHAGGLTNKEKLRKKNYVMVRRGKREVNNKIRKSNSDQRYEKMHAKEQFGRDKRKRRRT